MDKLNKMSHFQKQPRKGFTLIEVVITLGILSFLMAGIYGFFIESYNFQTFVSEQNDAVSTARDGVEQLVYEIREAAPADTGAYTIELADEQELIFFSDVDADVLTERIRYFLDGTNLKKGVIEPTYDPLAEQTYAYDGTEVITTIGQAVQNGVTPIFTYYNGDWPGDIVNNPLSYPADPTEVKLIKIYLEVNINPAKVPETYQLENYVQLRNLKDNL